MQVAKGYLINYDNNVITTFIIITQIHIITRKRNKKKIINKYYAPCRTNITVRWDIIENGCAKVLDRSSDQSCAHRLPGAEPSSTSTSTDSTPCFDYNQISKTLQVLLICTLFLFNFYIGYDLFHTTYNLCLNIYMWALRSLLRRFRNRLTKLFLHQAAEPLQLLCGRERLHP